MGEVTHFHIGNVTLLIIYILVCDLISVGQWVIFRS